MGPSQKNKRVISEINVTPLVDVMLVLLVIFMISAPLLLNGINLDLPKTKRVNPVQLSPDQIILSFDRGEIMYLGKDKILEKELIPLLKEKIQTSSNKTIFLRADFGLKYGSVANLMSKLKVNGFHQIALITEVEKE
jgi:biopolymer transport protein TolR